MASQPKKKRIICQATIFYVERNTNNPTKCGRIQLKGKDGEFNKMIKKATTVHSKLCGDDECVLNLFWKKPDGSQIHIADDASLNGMFHDVPRLYMLCDTYLEVATVLYAFVDILAQEAVKNCSILAKVTNCKSLTTLFPFLFLSTFIELRL